MMYPVVILAGGLATRLRPLTEKIPKSLVEIKGEPFIAHQLRLLRKNNIRRIILCIGYLGEQISGFVGDGSQYGLQVSYVHDGPQLLGTGGAILKTLPLFVEDAFFILYGDSYLPCDYSSIQAALIHSQKKALMTVFKNKGLWDTSNIEFKDGKIIAYNKKQLTQQMHYIDYGLGIMKKNTLDHLSPDQPYNLADIYQTLLQQDQLAAFEVKQRFYEVGSFAGIKELEYYLE